MTNTLCRTESRRLAIPAARVLSLSALLLAAPAFAGPKCTSEPAAKWSSIDELRKKIVAQGYKIDVLKVTKDGCYELYGRNHEQQRVEIYYHPVTFEAVKTSVR